MMSAALVGAPNSGKTTLYNWLTQSRFKTVNYPGSTVEYALGKAAPQWGVDMTFIDTPGIYSLQSQSEDEKITRKVLFEKKKELDIERVIVVIDGTQLRRHLLVLNQVLDTKIPCVVAVTMSDLVHQAKAKLDLKKLQEWFGCPFVFVDGRLGGGIDQLVKALRETDGQKGQPQANLEKVVSQALQQDDAEKIDNVYDATAKWDRWILHPVLGHLIFLAVMTALFTSIFWLAAPFMDIIDGAFSSLAEKVPSIVPEGLFASFLSDGIIASFGAVFVFVPQIFILFIGMSLLESSGYLARAATLIDRPLSAIGMSGRSFVPILSGYACAVPGIMAARNLSTQRERLIASWIIPLMTCSARLPVYALLLSFLFHDESPFLAGISLAALYIGAAVVGTIAAAILNKMLAKTEKSFFMMELPLYRRPKLRVIFHQAWTRSKAYVMRAGPIIFMFAVLVWVGTTFPNYQADGEHRLQTSYLAKAGQAIEPVFQPMGVDWRVGVSLITAFAAREVFVSSLAVMFGVTAEDEDGQTQGLLANMSEAKNSQGHLIFTPLTVLGLILFFMIALQCMSTVGVAVRETNSWKFAITQLVVFNGVAYVLAVAVVEIGRMLGWT